MKYFLYIVFIGISISLNAQEFTGSNALRIDVEAAQLDFEPSTFKIPVYSLGVETPKGNWTLSQVGIPQESNLPRTVDMRAIMDKEQRTTRREVTKQSFESLQQKSEKQSIISVEGRVVNPYGDTYDFRGIKNPSYQDARIPTYVSPYRRRSLWDY